MAFRNHSSLGSTLLSLAVNCLDCSARHKTNSPSYLPHLTWQLRVDGRPSEAVSRAENSGGISNPGSEVWLSMPCKMNLTSTFTSLSIRFIICNMVMTSAGGIVNIERDNRCQSTLNTSRCDIDELCRVGAHPDSFEGLMHHSPDLAGVAGSWHTLASLLGGGPSLCELLCPEMPGT